MKLIRLTPLAFAALAIVAPAFANAADKTMTIPITEQNKSGEKGMATLTDGPKGLEVMVKLDGAPADAQPMHIHKGTCAHLNPKPTYPLTSLASGASTSTVEGVTLAMLEKNVYSINVHKSTSDIKTYVACGRIQAPHKM